MSNDVRQSPAARVMDEAIELAIQELTRGSDDGTDSGCEHSRRGGLDGVVE
jgi:hypothetical protein